MMERDSSSWIEEFARFLNDHNDLEGIRFDPRKQTLEIATLGRVDADWLRAQIADTIRGIEEGERHAVSTTATASGVRIRRNGTEIRIEKPSCPTGERMRRWESVAWPEEAEETGEEWRFLALMAALCGVLGLAGFALGFVDGVPGWLTVALFVGAMIAGGWDAAIDVREGLPKGEFDIHFLMLAVALGASFIGAWAEGALLLFLFSFSGALEHFALYRTRREINSLFDAAPKTAKIITDDGEREIPIDAVQRGQHLRVRPGEQFPVDAAVLTGETAADESTLTGEAHPVEKSAGDTVFGGTINAWGTVEVEVLRLPAESSLQRIIKLIREAQHLKAPSQRFTDKFGTRYTLGILAITALMFFVWWLGFGLQPFSLSAQRDSAFYRAMTLLVVASPCALVLSIPSAILAAIAWGARRGILFRGGAAIERLAEVDIVALDKTGTLTTGEIVVERVESFPPGREREVAELAFSLEAKGSHPIGRAILKHGRKEGLEARPMTHFRSMTGKGVSAQFDGLSCILGRRELIEAGPFAQWIADVPDPDPEYLENWILYDSLIGRILLKDQIRSDSKPILKALEAMGIRTIMLTGDRRGSAEAVARELGLTEVRSGLKPEEKVMAIHELQQSGHKVAMIGDGVNDAPCLAAAFVSVAMGARGSDAALEQSEIVLVDDRIDNFRHAHWLSCFSRAVIRQNLAISIGTVVLMAAAAIFGLIPLSIGVFAHEGSTAIVCLNSLRILFVKPD